MKARHPGKLAKLFVLALIAVLAMTACGKDSGGKSGSGNVQQFTWQTKHGEFKLSERIAKKVANGEQLIIRVSTWDPAAPFFQDVRDGLDQAAKEFGFDVAMIGPADGVMEKQVAELETLISADKVDGLAISSGDADVMTPIFEKAWEKGIPIMTYDGDSPESKRLAYVGVPHVEVGKLGGKAVAKFYPDKKGKMALFAAFPEGVYARERMEGLNIVLQENGYELEQVGPFKLGLDMAEGFSVVESTFKANPDIQLIYVADEFVQVAAEYVSRNNLKDKVVVIGVNTLPGVIQFVEDGTIKQTTGLNAAGQGYTVVKNLYEFITKGQTTDEITNVEVVDVTSENVAQYSKK